MKILYGIDLEDDVSLDILKELIIIGGLYDASVQEVAGQYLEKYLTKENVFDLFELCKLKEADRGIENCLNMIVNNFTKEEVFFISRNIFYLQQLMNCILER